MQGPGWGLSLSSQPCGGEGKKALLLLFLFSLLCSYPHTNLEQELNENDVTFLPKVQTVSSSSLLGTAPKGTCPFLKAQS